SGSAERRRHRRAPRRSSRPWRKPRCTEAARSCHLSERRVDPFDTKPVAPACALECLKRVGDASGVYAARDEDEIGLAAALRPGGKMLRRMDCMLCGVERHRAAGADIEQSL